MPMAAETEGMAVGPNLVLLANIKTISLPEFLVFRTKLVILGMFQCLMDTSLCGSLICIGQSTKSSQ